MTSKLPVIEIFGPTIQGEGPQVGRKTLFVRTAGCDYSCAWCDSAFTWDGSGKDLIRMMEIEEIVSELKSLDPSFDYLVISGGNPALIGEPMKLLIDKLHESGVEIGLETQGSKWQDWFVDIHDLIISPKPPSSGMETNFDSLRSIIENLKNNQDCKVVLKVVVFDDGDYLYAKSIQNMFPHLPLFLSVGNSDILEAGSISQRVLDDYTKLIQKVVLDPSMQNVRVLPQIHTLIWGNKKGV